MQPEGGAARASADIQDAQSAVEQAALGERLQDVADRGVVVGQVVDRLAEGGGLVVLDIGSGEVVFF